MQALVWRDNKFVTLLSTVYIGNPVKLEVKRWEKETRSYRQVITRYIHPHMTHTRLFVCTIQVEARLAVKAYRDSMPFVDQGDRNSSHFDIFAAKCKRRYHRRPFQWMLSFVGLNNVLSLFDLIFPGAEKLKKKWNHNGLGYKVCSAMNAFFLPNAPQPYLTLCTSLIFQTWFQDTMGDSLIQRGIDRDPQDRKKLPVVTTSTTDGETDPAPACTTTVQFCPPVTPFLTTTTDQVTPTVRNKKRGGRPSKRKSSAGRPSTAKKRVVKNAASSSTDDSTVPPFLPKLPGRKSSFKVLSEGCILIKGDRHTLRDDVSDMPKVSTCKICYLKNTKTVSGGPRRTKYACDKCRRMMCSDCFRVHTSHGSLDRVKGFLCIY